jgi:hypothetical protein
VQYLHNLQRNKMSQPPASEYLSLREAAKIFGYKWQSLRKLAQRGQLPGATKAGHRWRVHLPTINKAWQPKPYTPTPPGFGASILKS